MVIEGMMINSLRKHTVRKYFECLISGIYVCVAWSCYAVAHLLSLSEFFILKKRKREIFFLKEASSFENLQIHSFFHCFVLYQYKQCVESVCRHDKDGRSDDRCLFILFEGIIISIFSTTTISTAKSILFYVSIDTVIFYFSLIDY